MKPLRRTYTIEPLIALALLAGCSSPKIMLHTSPLNADPSAFHGTKALAPASWVTIGEPETDSKKDGAFKTGSLTQKDKSSLKALVTPSLSGFTWGIEPRDKWYATTRMSYTYWDNSYQLKTLGFAFEDNAVKYIQGVSSVVTTLAGLGPAINTPSTMGVVIDKSSSNEAATLKAVVLTTPIVISLDDDVTWSIKPEPGEKYSKATERPFSEKSEWWFRVEITKEANVARKLGSIDICSLFGNNADACTLSELRKTSISSNWLKVAPVSRCVDVTLYIGGPGLDSPAKFPIKIADPKYVDLVPLPEKGTITMHSVCGADLAVESGSSEGTRAIATIQAVLTEVQKLKVAQDAKAGQ